MLEKGWLKRQLDELENIGAKEIFEILKTDGMDELASAGLKDLAALTSERDSLRKRVEELTEALEGIRYHGIDKPAAMGGPDSNVDVDWWKSIAFSCMRKAANALDQPAPHEGEEG